MRRMKNAPAAATAGPVSIWMIIFVMAPMIYVFVISFMTIRMVE